VTLTPQTGHVTWPRDVSGTSKQTVSAVPDEADEEAGDVDDDGDDGNRASGAFGRCYRIITRRTARSDNNYQYLV